jgi:hypothetical protein
MKLTFKIAGRNILLHIKILKKTAVTVFYIYVFDNKLQFVNVGSTVRRECVSSLSSVKRHHCIKLRNNACSYLSSGNETADKNSAYYNFLTVFSKIREWHHLISYML